MKIRLWLCTILFWIPQALVAQTRETLVELIIEKPEWSVSGKPVELAEDDFDSLLGTNVQALINYGLTGASRTTFQGPGGLVDAFLLEMTDSTAAHGIFSLERDWRNASFQSVPLGAEAYLIGKRLTLWQSNFFVKLVGPVTTVKALARLLSKNIIGRSLKAPVSRHLPPEGLIAESEKYILDPGAFEALLDMESDHFGFADSVEVAVAQYDVAEPSVRLVMLLYPTQQLAAYHVTNWSQQTGSISHHKRSGPLLAIVQGTSDPVVSGAILAKLNYESQVTWNEGLPDPLTLPHLILTIFTWIGIAFLFTVVAGVGFGGWRIYVKTRNPNQVLGSEEATNFIQLNISQSVTSKQID